MVRTILVIGAGKSTSYLLDYLLKKSDGENIRLKIGDLHPENIPEKFSKHPNCSVFSLDIFNEADRKKAVSEASIVVSMLPASLHINVARDCIEFEKHFITASYVSDELRALDAEVKEKNLVFMNEIGLDPVSYTHLTLPTILRV